MGEVDRDVDAQVDDEGSGRREFLKKAGKIAFVVPAIQVLSMAPAGAQSNGSVVTTSMPPGSTMPPTSSTSTSSTTSSSTTSSSTTSSTSTSSTTTTEAPCVETRYRLKAEWDETTRQLTWTTGVGANDCLTDSSMWDEEALGSDIGDFGINIDQLDFDTDTGELFGGRIWTGGECYLDFASAKVGTECVIYNLFGPITIFVDVTTPENPSISHFEVIAVCCEPPE
ncbi:hypothetical protein MNBD_ACTINO02-975 [hydrothermal vent metagenome]|uniref:Uncharacterized protein n=1 Tax=hydrothermal vent metagenome TaxID=652676 RepID=A0A3B0T6E8_9ZZZZ